VSCQSLLGENGLVILERYFLRGQTDPIVAEVSGSVKACCETYECKYILQEPSVPAFMYGRFSLKGKMRGITNKQHGKDALCHLLYYLYTNKFILEEDVLRIVKDCGIIKT